MTNEQFLALCGVIYLVPTMHDKARTVFGFVFLILAALSGLGVIK